MFSTLSPDQVRSDPFLIAIYRAIIPKLPEFLRRLRVNKIQKGTFKNGTIVYNIIYGKRSSEDTHELSIFFDPNSKQIKYLYLKEVEKII